MRTEMNTKDTSTTDATLNRDSQETLLSFRHQLFRFACGKLPEWDAEDAVQETLIKGFYGLKSLRKPERLQSWLYAICRNEISNILQAGSQEILEEDPDRFEQKPDGPVQFFTDRIGPLIAKLGPTGRQLIRLKYTEGLSYRKMALLLGIPEPLVKSRLYETRQKLVSLSRNPGRVANQQSLFMERMMRSFTLMQSAAEVFSCLSLENQAAMMLCVQSGKQLGPPVNQEIARFEKGKSFLDATGGILDERDLAAILSLADENVRERLFSHLPHSDFLQAIRRIMALPDLVQKEDKGLHLTTEEVPDNTTAVILFIEGYIDSYNSDEFLEQVLTLLDSGFRLLVFECSKFSYISSTGIGAFAKIQNRITEAGGELAILALSDPIREVFRLLGIDRFFCFFAKKQGALNWLTEFTIRQSSESLEIASPQDRTMQNFSRLQLDLLPLRRGESGAFLPEIELETDNLEICGFFRPSPQFSGDYFQYYQAKHLFLIVKCDCSGHKPETAHVMIKIAALFNRSINRILDLETHGYTDLDEYSSFLVDLMEQVNSALTVPDLSGQFAALQIMMIDSVKGGCLIVNAGDNRVPVYRNSGELEYLELTSSPSAGLFTTDLIKRKGGFVIDRINLKPGDALFFITDGLEESARNVRDENGRNLETNEGYPMTETIGTGRITGIIEASFSGNHYRMELQNVMGQVREYYMDFTEYGRTLRSAVDGLVACDFLFHSYPDNERFLTDASTDSILKKYVNGYSPSLESEKIRIEDGAVYQNLGMDDQYEDLTILAVRRKT
jgi:RNA polymerase sigma factor (sigma-70 family)/anti-anti-sigma factor